MGKLLGMAFIISCCGCGTSKDLTTRFLTNQRELEPYGGVRSDLREIDSRIAKKPSEAIAPSPDAHARVIRSFDRMDTLLRCGLLIIDLPLSATADTLLLGMFAVNSAITPTIPVQPASRPEPSD
jgi:uncharacterized protein YceK